MHQSKQSGVSLIEVLVAMLIASLGILSMIAMQINATKYTKTSEVRTMGTLLVGDLTDRMRANKAGFLAGSYFIDPATKYPDDGPVKAPEKAQPTCNEAASKCDVAQLAAQDLADWQRSVFFALPGGSARISKPDLTGSENAADIWLIWAPPQGDASFDNNATECPSAAIPSKATVTPRCLHFRVNI
ncbi:MAG: type IV pilus modification protein PilV [Aquabacterium sp.]|nr:type IV pilus modification protein PilV [Aquabacterium sp.]